MTTFAKLCLASLIIGRTLSATTFADPTLSYLQQTPSVSPTTADKKPDIPTAKQLSPNPDSFGIYHAEDGVIAPKLIYTVEPEFSEKARKKKIRGDCLVSLIVRTDGTTTDVHVAKSIAETVPKKARDAALSLDENALKVVEQYRFTPATYRGTPVPYRLNVEVNYQIW
jgi:TonB family protein